MTTAVFETPQFRAGRASIAALLRLLRPHQWTKNLLVFAGILFSGRFVSEPIELAVAGATFVVFCLASSAVYALNDVIDRGRDRAHPVKRHRPVASGAVGVPVALAISTVLAGAALAGSLLVDGDLIVWLALYLLNSLAYALWLKHAALLDLLSISIGFVLRLLAGCYAVDVVPTSWIVLCTFFLAMFLAAAKRRGEVASSAAGADSIRRPVLSKYSVQFLDQLVNNTGTMAVMCYALFTLFKNPTLVLTVPIVFYGIMHYKRLMMIDSAGEEPDRALLGDVRIQLTIVLWLCVFGLVMWMDFRYGVRLFDDLHRVGAADVAA